MRQYRLFLVDPARRIEDERAFAASNDIEAKQIADELRGSRRAELWTAHRRIARWG
jgi:hypothetical protein